MKGIPQKFSHNFAKENIICKRGLASIVLKTLSKAEADIKVKNLLQEGAIFSVNSILQLKRRTIVQCQNYVTLSLQLSLWIDYYL